MEDKKLSDGLCDDSLLQSTTADLLYALLFSNIDRGDYIKEFAKCALLMTAKSSDYSGDDEQSPFLKDRTDYFPFGDESYATMIHTKSKRLNSLILTKKEPNYDKVEDILRDLVNYALFYLEYLATKEK